MNDKKEYIDLGYLIEASGGDRLMIIEIADLFKQQIPEIIDWMNVAYLQNDWISLGKAAHKGKTSLRIVGMWDLAFELEKIDKDAKLMIHELEAMKIEIKNDTNTEYIDLLPEIVSKLNMDTAQYLPIIQRYIVETFDAVDELDMKIAELPD